jgi:HEAT repeat protein
MQKTVAAVLLAVALSGCAAHGPPAGEKWPELAFGARLGRARVELSSPNSNTRRWAVLRLARAGDLSATEQITPLLDSASEPSAIVRSTAAVALRMLGDKRALPALTAALDDPEPFVRADAAEAIGNLGDAGQAAPLARALQSDPDARVRLQAAMALRRAAGPLAVPPLILALDDADESVSFAAHQGLMGITGQNLPPSRERWGSGLHHLPRNRRLSERPNG